MAAAAVEFDWIVERKLNYLRDRFIADAVNFKIALFLNNVTVTPDTVLADLTIATDSGLVMLDEHPSDWGDAVSTAHVAVMLSAVVHTWTLTGSPKTVYGYAILNSGATALRFAETFTTPVALIAGQSITIQTRIKDRSQLF